MARSRVGGSSGKLSGKVGDVIYSITRNPDGSFKQLVSVNPAERENPNTEAQAKARLTMATIERAMFTFKDMMGTGFEGVDAGTNSVSKFSEVNVNKFKEDIAAAWDNDMYDYVRLDVPLKGNKYAKDGEFIISQGSLRKIEGITNNWSYGAHVHFNFNMVHLGNYNTLKEALWESNFYIGDQIAVFMFGRGQTPSQSFLVWFTMWTDESQPPTTIITKDNYRQFLKFKSNIPLKTRYNEQTHYIEAYAENLESYGLYGFGCIGYRRRHYKNGHFCYSTQSMKSFYNDPWTRYSWASVPDVKSSWII